MSISRIATSKSITQGTVANAIVTNATLNIAAHDTILLFIRDDGNAISITSLADTAGNTYTLVDSVETANPGMRSYLCLDCAASSVNVITVTYASSQTFAWVFALQLRDSNGIPTLDQHTIAAGAHGLGTITAPSLTTTGAGYIGAAVSEANLVTYAAGTGYTLIDGNVPGAAGDFGGVEEHIPSGAVTESASFTGSSGLQYAIAVIALLAAVSAGGTLNAGPGTIAISGDAAILNVGVNINAAGGSYAVTGDLTQAAYGLPGTAGSYAVTGDSATLTSSVTIASVNDPNWFFSPYNWYSDGAGSLAANNIRASSTLAWSNNPGAYFKTVFSGTSCSLLVDVSGFVANSVAAGDYPAIKYSVDGGGFTRYLLLNTDTQVTLATGLSAGPHTLVVYFVAIGVSTDRWVTPVAIFSVSGLRLDSGAVLTAPTLLPRNIIIYGDSITEGEEVLAAGFLPINQDAQDAYSAALSAVCRNGEYGNIGFSGTGYTAGGNGGAPVLTAGWNLYATGKSRLVSTILSPAPDIILCDDGINDGATDITTTVTAMIGSWRTAAPLAHIVIMVPWSGNHATQIAAGVTAASDANAFAINTGNTSYNPSGSHLSVLGQSQYEGDLCPLVTAVTATAYTVAATAGAVTVTGDNLGLPLSINLNAAAGSYVETGSLVNAGYGLIGVAGAYVIHPGAAYLRGPHDPPFAGGVTTPMVPQLRLRRAVLPI